MANEFDHKGERRQDGVVGMLRCMIEAEGWVMARRKGCIPFVMKVAEWETIPLVVAAPRKKREKEFDTARD